MKAKIIIILAVLGWPQFLHADVVLAPLFRDHAVLQRDKDVKVWGRADAGEDVTVTFKGQTVRAKADDAGRWEAQLKAMPASSESAELQVAGKNTLKVQDMLVGEVWFCAGQSNMAFHLQKTTDGKEAVREANFPLIRAYSVPRKVSETPLTESAGEWRVASPETAGTMSGVAFYFARDLYQRLNVPVGVITTSWGGTFIESWVQPEALKSAAIGPMITERWRKNLEDYPKLKSQYDIDLAKWKDAKAVAEKAGKKFTKRDPFIPSGPGHEDTPSGLFQAMVNPFIPYTIRGFVWYQGESNALRPTEYAELMQVLIKGWRTAFQQGELPFFWVQLPKYGYPDLKEWALLREAQGKTLALPATGQVVTVDFPLDDPKNKHPLDKLSVCKRLAQLVASQVYGDKKEYSGPQFTGIKKEGGVLRVQFTHAEGLRASPSPLVGFEVAGADERFYPATALIENQNVVVKAEQVTEPVAVRYAFNNYPETSLYNGAGFPAAPFRSDTWVVKEVKP